MLNFPNQDFFKTVGSVSDHTSLLSRSQFLYVRHGQSTANVLVSAFDEAYAKATTKEEELSLKTKYFNDINSDKFLDAPLNEIGIK